MRLTERVREFIQMAGCCMLKRTVCNFSDEEVGGLDMVTTDEALPLKCFQEFCPSASVSRYSPKHPDCAANGPVSFHNVTPAPLLLLLLLLLMMMMMGSTYCDQ